MRPYVIKPKYKQPHRAHHDGNEQLANATKYGERDSPQPVGFFYKQYPAAVFSNPVWREHGDAATSEHRFYCPEKRNLFQGF